MKTATEIGQHLEKIITNIYRIPGAYGQTATEVENALFIYHNTWAYVTDREGDYWTAVQWACEIADCGSKSFNWGYRKSSPHAPEHEVLQFVLKHWAMVSKRLNIPVPESPPDPRYSLLPNTL